MNGFNQIEKDLRKIRDEVLDCKKCPLYKTRVLPVIGEGNHQAKIVLCGEAPGFNESKTGRPFCGHAGRVLDELLESVGIKRQEVYIANILKDRPPQNRNPQKEEIEACAPYLERQIEIIKPKIIGALGNYATAYILEKYGLKEEIQGISKIHGEVFEAKISFGQIKIIPFYHPAVVVYNQNMKRELEKDFKILKKV
ncbi:MAG: uracil-DNA glycosylase [Candidatus Portnoybacteria bacterium]|nr:uracil-DNA glycosylase [Candidatus Portnoybacteria bacterium]